MSLTGKQIGKRQQHYTKLNFVEKLNGGNPYLRFFR